jgi:Flp pilus assembly pilin Flp
MRNSLKKRVEKGQTLSEYGLAIALVAVLAIAPLALLGGNISDLFFNVLSTSSSKTKTAVVASPSAGQTGTPPSGNSIVQNVTVNQMSIKLLDGTAISVSAYSRDTAASVLTAGTNGETTILANTLASAAQALLEQGKITESEANLLIALANQGHRIAEIEKAFEDAAVQAGGGDKLEDAGVQLDGKTVDIYKIIDMIGGVSSVDETHRVRGGNEVNAFQALYNQAKALSIMQDPAVFALVTDVSNNILKLADITANLVDPLEDSRTITVETIRTNAASQITNKDSKTICTSGGGSSNGNSCNSNSGKSEDGDDD